MLHSIPFLSKRPAGTNQVLKKNFKFIKILLGINNRTGYFVDSEWQVSIDCNNLNVMDNIYFNLFLKCPDGEQKLRALR